MRLKSSFRYWTYAVFSVLLATGAAWLVADWEKDADDAWQQAAANLLMIHGGAAMLALMALGALIPLHLLRAWRAGRNLVSGITVATANAVLIVTAFGLYYLGSEVLRPWISWIHIGAGVFLGLMLPLHVILGRRARA